MALYAAIVARDEAEGFLPAFIEHYAGAMFDGVHLFDDQSVDNTASMARNAGYQVTVRPSSVPSFVQHEGAFRGAAWQSAVDVLGIQPGDLVFAPDCDEFLLGPVLSEGTLTSFLLNEIWSIDPPLARTDGTWANNWGVRLTVFDPSARFHDAKCGPGSVPMLDHSKRPLSISRSMSPMLHYGYTKPGATRDKFERYSNRDGNRHSPDHVDSILRRPNLQPWTGPVPSIRLPWCTTR